LLKTPDWTRLETDYRLRHHFLGDPVPADFEATAEQPLPDMV